MGVRGLVSVGSVLLMGCPAERPGDPQGASETLVTVSGTSSTSGGSTAGDSATSTAAPTSTTGSEGTDESDSNEPKLDLIVPDAPDPTMEGCGKIDFVFSVDNSCSTEDDQATLAMAFAEFTQLIRDNVEGDDWHIMVVDSDGDPSWACSEFGGGTCCPDYVVGSHEFDACDLELGAGVRAPYGGNASNTDCGIPDPDRRYLEVGDAPLEDMFSCIAQVGTSGHFSEFPMSAAVRALENPMGCNDGFLRDDAILVMTVITDDHGGDSGYPGDAEMGDAMDWYNRIVAAKGGNEDASVFIALTSNHCAMPPEPPFMEIVDLFGDQGVQGSHCTLAEMVDSFAAAIEPIETTCDDFVPQ